MMAKYQAVFNRACAKQYAHEIRLANIQKVSKDAAEFNPVRERTVFEQVNKHAAQYLDWWRIKQREQGWGWEQIVCEESFKLF